ncbi:MAG: hypothetical protein JWO49_773 [Arthrobacter sp.]|nr:hypothetical protein [Arthrobacter sp.]MCU1549119.1 hypothetical protein [Arthrobacter sp.]
MAATIRPRVLSGPNHAPHNRRHSSFIDACFDDRIAGTSLCFTIPTCQPFEVVDGNGVIRAEERSVNMGVLSEDQSRMAS